MFPRGYFGGGYFGPTYWPSGINVFVVPDVICFDLIIDGVTAQVNVIEDVSSELDIERDLGQIVIDTLSLSLLVERDLATIRFVECDD